MTETTVLVGPFRRPAFAEGLAAALAERTELTVIQTDPDDIARRIAAAPGPVVLILDRTHSGEALAAVPQDAPVSAIVIGDEGREVRVSLRDVAMAQLDAIVRFVSEAARRVALRPHMVRP